MSLENTLKTNLEGKNTLDGYISAFEKMCEEPSCGVDETLLFETGNYSFSGEKEFYFSLVRQYEIAGREEFVQVHLDVIYPKVSFLKLKSETFWSDEDPNNDYAVFFKKVKESKTYLYLTINGISPIRVEVREEET